MHENESFWILLYVHIFEQNVRFQACESFDRVIEPKFGSE